MTRFADCLVDDLTLDQARRGDPEACAAVYRLFSTPVFNLALRLTRHRMVAEEVLQDTFVEVLTKLGSYRAAGPLYTWVRGIAVNKCLMHLRSGWHRKAQRLQDLGPGNDDMHAVPARPEHLDLEKALAGLSPVSRAVVWLHDVEGYTHQEIGRMMGKSSSFSKSQLARAHQRLQDVLESGKGYVQPCMQLSNNY